MPDRKTTRGINDLNHVFRKSLIGRGEFLLGDFTKITLEGVWNIYSRGWWLQPGLEWSVTDGVQILGDLDLLGGPDDSFLGGFEPQRAPASSAQVQLLKPLGSLPHRSGHLQHFGVHPPRPREIRREPVGAGDEGQGDIVQDVVISKSNGQQGQPAPAGCARAL